MTGQYDGPAGIVLSRAEAEHVYAVLRLYPRAENGALRERIERYLESTWNRDAEKRAP